MPDTNSPKVTRAGEDSPMVLLGSGSDQSRLSRSWLCPSDHTIAAYTDGVLGKRKKLWVEFHLARCQRCRLVVADVVKAQREADLPLPPAQLIRKAEGVVGPKTVRRRWVWAPAGALAGIALLAAFTGIWRKLEQLNFPSPLAPPGPLIAKSEPAPAPKAAVRDIVRGPQSAKMLPTILFPHPGSVIRGESLQFRWKPISQSRHYQVRVVRSDGDLAWEGETEKSALQVPSDVAVQDGSYFVWITALLENGQVVKSPPVRFQIKR